MPTRQRHREYAEKSMATARNLYEHDPHNAGEILWAALLEALQCQSHLTNDGDHFKSPKRAKRIIESLVLNKLNLQ